jgi:DNA-binding MarR family transcriptional regulator
MTTLRSECRATLAWCLEQEDGFTQRECYEHFLVHQVAISKNFCRLENMGLLKRELLRGRLHSYTVINRPLAQQIADERPGPKNGYIPVGQRSNRAQTSKSAPATSRWQGVNSVFAIAA